jgi:hypothetical protein
VRKPRRKEFYSEGAHLPKWVIDHFSEAFNSHDRLIDVFSISRHGIGLLTKMPRLTKALAVVDAEKREVYDKQIADAEARASLANSEIEKDFPQLSAFAAVALWGWLEALTKDLLVGWLLNKSGATDLPQISKINIKIGHYFSLSRTEQAGYIVDALDRELSSPLRGGVNRFESTLEPFGLSGVIDADVAREIFELQHIRNAIAHRGGRCDVRLKKSCPWLKVRLNAPIPITSEKLYIYAAATSEYGLQLLYRVGDLYGFNARESPVV